MNIKELVPASQLARQLGVKAVVYGGPGTAKTPISATAPRPVMCVIEPGMLSMRGVDNIPAFEAYTPKKIEEFFKWVFESKEASNFDTIVIDSLSQLCEVILEQELARNVHGLQAYGKMATRVLKLINKLYFHENKHAYIIAKQTTGEIDGAATKLPYFPGKELNVKIPHLFDEIFHIGKANVPGQAKPVLAMRTQNTFGIMARDRSGKLDELEPPNLSDIFAKCMS